MDLVLLGLQWSQCLVYLDDVIVVGRTFDEHRQDNNLASTNLSEGGAAVPGNCQLLPPVYSRFRLKIAKPLHRLTKRTTKFVWNSECQTAFEELRRRLSQTPILAHPDFNRQFILDTDASDVGIGAVLSQVGDGGHERVMAYGSRLLTKAERQYCVTRKELLSVVTFTRQYRSYLLGRRFVLRTDGSRDGLNDYRNSILKSSTGQGRNTRTLMLSPVSLATSADRRVMKITVRSMQLHSRLHLALLHVALSVDCVQHS